MKKGKKLYRKRFFSIITVMVLMLSTLLAPLAGAGVKVSAYETAMRGLTAKQIVAEMGAGWNMGNSLKSENSETGWGNPRITKAMVQAIANRGFKTIRIPVRWDDNYSDSSNYTIKTEYLDRVEEVVNYGLDCGLYVIINVHHNDLQTLANYNSSDQWRVKQELTAIWTQVGNRFKNYGDKLVFEVNNEPRNDNDWGGDSTLYDVVNQYNEAGRAAIRATGGNNTKRLVMLPTYCASADEPKVAGWKQLSSDDMIAVSIHAYHPFDFAFQGDGHSNWTDDDYNQLKQTFDRLNSYFTSKNIPVVIGEFGCTNKNNYDDRVKAVGIYAGMAKAQGMACIIWDNNYDGYGSECFKIFDRDSCTFTYDGIAGALVDTYNNGTTPSNTPVTSTTPSTNGSSISLFSGSSTASNWAQAVSVATTRCGGSFDASNIQSSGSFYIEYSGTQGEVELIFQSLSGGEGWAKVNSSESGSTNGHYYARYSYNNCVSAFNSSNFQGLLDKIYVGAKSSSVTVYSFAYETGNITSTTTPVVSATPSSTTQSTAGFYVNGTTVCDANGNSFVMRGINVAHAWYTDKTETSLKAIAATGANTVRIVLSDGQQYTKTTAQELSQIISLCKQNNLIAVLEVHDATGDDNTYSLNAAVDYWKEMKDLLSGNEKYVIVNIANEWYGTWNGYSWAEGNKTAIKNLRNAGIKNMIMVDCAGWGQYPDSIKDYGKSVFEADTLKNTVFSIHMYEYAGKDSSTVKTNINNVLNLGIPVVIGEFADRHTNGDVDEATIMSYCKEKGVGYIGWSWKGNNSDLAYLDIAYNWDGSSLSDWGTKLIYGDNGIKNTSVRCSVFTGGTVISPSPSIQPSQVVSPSPSVQPSQTVSPSPSTQPNYVSLFYGSSYASSWAQAVEVVTSKNGGSFDASNIKSGGHFYVEYTGTKDELELIFQSWSGGSSWGKVSISETGTANGHYFAKFSYNNCVSAFGSNNFSGLLDKVCVSAKDNSLTVYSVCYCYQS